MKEFNPFRLDPVNHRLWRVSDEGEHAPITITAKALDVLRYLVDHPGRLVSHEELLEALWSGVDVQPEVLKGHVLAIRNALGDDAQRPRRPVDVDGRETERIADELLCQRHLERLFSASVAMQLNSRGIRYWSGRQIAARAHCGPSNLRTRSRTLVTSASRCCTLRPTKRRNLNRSNGRWAVSLLRTRGSVWSLPPGLFGRT